MKNLLAIIVFFIIWIAGELLQSHVFQIEADSNIMFYGFFIGLTAVLVCLAILQTKKSPH